MRLLDESEQEFAACIASLTNLRKLKEFPLDQGKNLFVTRVTSSIDITKLIHLITDVEVSDELKSQ